MISLSIDYVDFNSQEFHALSICFELAMTAASLPTHDQPPSIPQRYHPGTSSVHPYLPRCMQCFCFIYRYISESSTSGIYCMP